MIPNTLESWLWLLMACVIGYIMGQWVKSRRKRANAGEEAAEQIRRQLAHGGKAAKSEKGKRRKEKTQAGRG